MFRKSSCTFPTRAKSSCQIAHLFVTSNSITQCRGAQKRGVAPGDVKGRLAYILSTTNVTEYEMKRDATDLSLASHDFAEFPFYRGSSYHCVYSLAPSRSPCMLIERKCHGNLCKVTTRRHKFARRASDTRTPVAIPKHETRPAALAFRQQARRAHISNA